MNLPNRLTLGRLILTVFFVAFLSTSTHWGDVVALILFIFAALTDWLDGYLARRLNQITNFGKLMDPLADKVLDFRCTVVDVRLATVEELSHGHVHGAGGHHH